MHALRSSICQVYGPALVVSSVVTAGSPESVLALYCLIFMTYIEEVALRWI
jgi:hypothetical protein